MKDNADFDAAFMNDETSDVEITPEPVIGKSPEPPDEKSKKGLLRYLAYGLGAVIILFVILIAWAVLSGDDSAPSQSSTTSTAQKTEALSAPASTEITQEEPAMPAAGTAADPEDIEVLRSQLKAAEQNTAIRDSKYAELATAYLQLKEAYKHLKEDKDSSNSKGVSEQQGRQTLPLIKGIKIVSIYDGYAFVRKGETVYGVQKGDKVNNAEITSIDPVLRKIITTKGVIQ